MDRAYKIFDFLHSICLISVGSPKILNNPDNIFNFLQSVCLISIRSPNILNNLDIIFDFLNSRCLNLTGSPNITDRSYKMVNFITLSWQYGKYHTKSTV